MKLVRILVIGLGALALLAVVGIGAGVWWIKSYVHSEAFRHEVEAQAGQALGGTVELTRIDWNLFSGIQLNGLVTNVTSDHGNLGLHVEKVSCSYSFPELLHQRVHIKNITITGPSIVLSQQKPAPTTPAPSVPAATAENAQKKAPPFDVIVDAVKIDDGDLLIQDETGATKADLKGISMTGDLSGYFGGKDVTGTLSVVTISLPDNLNLNNFSTPFIYRRDTLTASPFQLSAFSGQVSGDYKIDPTGPSLLNLKATRIDVAQAGQASNPNSATKLSGLLDLQSTWNSVETGKLTGQGDLQIGPGKLEGVTVLQDLAEAFKVPEMRAPDLKSVTCHFDVADGTTHFSNLQIVSIVFEMSGSGTIDPKGNLNANMMLVLHPDAFKRIPGIAANFFTKLPDGGGSIPFTLTGTAEKPVSDLTTRIFIQGSKINKSIKKALDNLFK